MTSPEPTDYPSEDAIPGTQSALRIEEVLPHEEGDETEAERLQNEKREEDLAP